MLQQLFGRRRRSVTSFLIALTLAVPVALVALVPAPASAILPTTTTVTATPASAVKDSPVTLTATVGLSGIGGLLIAPTGQVNFSATVGGATVQLGSAQLPGGCLFTIVVCSATLTTTALPVGNVTVTASYVGDSLADPSQGTTQVTVAPSPPAHPAPRST